MRKFTEQENKFLEALGITRGPWAQGDEKHSYSEYPSEVRTGYVMPGFTNTRRCLFSANTSFNDCYANAKLAAQAPAMFLTIFKSAMELEEYMHNENDIIFIENMTNVLEPATGKTFKELRELWKSLNGA